MKKLKQILIALVSAFTLTFAFIGATTTTVMAEDPWGVPPVCQQTPFAWIEIFPGTCLVWYECLNMETGEIVIEQQVESC